jgi:hypothetical protein
VRQQELQAVCEALRRDGEQHAARAEQLAELLAGQQLERQLLETQLEALGREVTLQRARELELQLGLSSELKAVQAQCADQTRRAASLEHSLQGASEATLEAQAAAEQRARHSESQLAAARREAGEARAELAAVRESLLRAEEESRELRAKHSSQTAEMLRLVEATRRQGQEALEQQSQRHKQRLAEKLKAAENKVAAAEANADASRVTCAEMQREFASKLQSCRSELVALKEQLLVRHCSTEPSVSASLDEAEPRPLAPPGLTVASQGASVMAQEVRASKAVLETSRALRRDLHQLTGAADVGSLSAKELALAAPLQAYAWPALRLGGAVPSDAQHTRSTRLELDNGLPAEGADFMSDSAYQTTGGQLRASGSGLARKAGLCGVCAHRCTESCATACRR